MENTIKELEELKSQPAAFISLLLKIKLKTPSEVEFQRLLITFSNEKNFDIFSICFESCKQGQSVFRIADLLSKSLPLIQPFKTESFVDLITCFAEKMKNDMMAGMFMAPVRELAKAQPDVAKELAKEILKRKQSTIYGYLNMLYLGLSDISFEDTYPKIESLIKSEDINLKGCGLRLIGLIITLPDSKYLDVKPILIESLKSPELLLAANSIFSICNLVDRDNSLKETILSTLIQKRPEIIYEILNHFKFDKNIISEQWQREFIYQATSYELKYKGITDCLDMIIYKSIQNDEFDFVRELLNAWVVNHSEQEHRDVRIDEQFPMSIFEILKNEPFVTTLTISWFNSDDPKFHHCISEILRTMKIHKLKCPQFSSTQVNELSKNDLFYVVKKILGYVYDFDYSVQLIYSLLQTTIVGEETERLFIGAFVAHIGYDYNYNTVNFLKQQLLNLESSEFTKKILETSVKILERESKKLLALMPIPEIKPNLDIQIKVNKAFQKQVNISMKAAQDKSPLLSAVTKVNINAGIGWFSFIRGEFSKIRYLNNFSHSVEMPKSEVVDEVGPNMTRSALRQSKRGEP